MVEFWWKIFQAPDSLAIKTNRFCG